ncbi:MAG: T9SS type A sorting domain-containing protein [Ignavibacteriales bacterium]|nr:T9SS type A sorting domain-containing protein [Ignavibacteriales bacterium]
MNLKNLINKLGLVLVLLTFAASASFAQTYVSNTNGNDITGTGTALQPYATIAKALSVVSDGASIVIDADTYNEATVNITKSVTLISQAFNASTTVTVTNGITVNGSGKTVNLGRTADASLAFNLGSTATALTLTDGTLNISQANVVIASGGRITRTAGTINETPTTTDVSVYYTPTASISAGPELPTSLGIGSLNITAGATTLTVGGNLALTSGQIVVVSGNATFSGNVSVTSDGPNANSIDNQGAGTVTFDLAISGSRASAGTPGTVLLNGAGTLTLTGGVTTSNFTFGLTNGAGTINVGPGTYGGAVTNNTAAGTINLLSSATFASTVSNGNATAVIKLNGFQLTLSGAVTLTNTGNIISATASTVGSGMLNITGNILKNGTGELPNVTIASGGKLTLGAATSVYGDLTLNSSTAGAITAGGFNLSVYGGSFNRTDNTPGNYTATGTLTFASSTAQSFNPGASLTLNNLTVNKGSSSVVTLGASVVVNGNLTITAGNLDVGNYNLNLAGGPSVFDNSGNSYSSTGVGYVVFQGASGTVTGTGTFGNILVNLSTAANAVATGSSINFSGILYINTGRFHIADGHTVTFNNTLVANPTVKINTTAANTAGLTKVTLGSGTVTYSSNVNLEYFGTGAYDVNTITFNAAAQTGGLEWTVQPLKLNNVTISTTNTITGFAGASTIAGTLTVGVGSTLAQGAFVYTLSGDSKTHSILGTVTGGSLTVSGTGSAVNGTTSTDAGNNATVNNLLFEPAANGATFTSTNLKTVGGSITLLGTSTKTGAVATVSMNPTTATLTGSLAVGNATVGPTASVTIAGSTTSVFGTNLTLTNGTLTLTRGGNASNIAGTATLTAGTLMLGSNVAVDGQTTQAAGNINAGGFKFTQNGSGASPDYNRTGAGTFTNGTLSLVSTGAAIDLTPGATFTVPNLESIALVNGVTINAAMEVTNSLLIDNAATFAQTGILTVSGNTVTVAGDAGAFTGALTLKGSAATLTLGQSYAIPTLVVNSTGSVTVAGDPAATARTLTVGTAFTLTAGTLNLGIHTLDVATAFTYTAGTITQSTGYLNLNVAAPTVAATGFSIDNLKVYTTATSFGTSAFTVVKNLVLAAALTTSADGKLTLGDGCLVERQGNAFTLSKIPTFGANTDLLYSTYNGGVDITTGKEAPATVRNLTVATDAGALKTILAANITVTGTLSLADMLDATTTASTAITMADGSTLELKVDGTSALDENLTKAGSMNLVYNGATSTTTRELGAITSGAYAAYSGSVTFKGAFTVALNSVLTLNGTTTFDGGSFNIAANALNIGGNVATTANGGNFTNTGAAAFLNMSGSSNTTFGLGASWSVPLAIKFRLNKSSNTSIVTLTGGNLDFATNNAVLYFANGVLATGSNNVILRHSDAGGVPTQGFDITGVTGTNASHVVGNVQKLIDATAVAWVGTAAIALTRVEFPVGTAPSSPAYYRPLAVQFNAPLPTSNFTLTVNHVDASPEGTNGFPLTSGTLTITNYPNFYWLIKSSLTLQPQVKYDIEASAAGYTDYELDGIQNVRFIRRFDNNTSNPWIVQGGSGYDNSTNGTTPVVIVRSAEGAISTQGARFTYSQLNKAPVLTTPADVAVNENDAVTVDWDVTDPDIGQTPTFVGVTWTPSTPAGAAFSTTTGTLTWTPTYTQAGTYTATVTATDGTLTTTDAVTIVVTDVNRAPSFTGTGTSTVATGSVKSGETFSFTYAATDADGDAIAYSVAVTPSPSGTYSISATLGTFTFSPVFADAGNTYTFTVTATDVNTATATTTTAINVNYPVNLGDVDASGSVTSADASLILQYVVGLVTFDAQELWAANVNGDSQVGALDAAWVLFYAVEGTWPTSKIAAAAGTMEMGKAYAGDAGVIYLPVSLKNTSGALSLYTELTIDENAAEVVSVKKATPDGWFVAHNYSNSTLKIAMAGLNSLVDNDVVVIGLKLKDKESSLNITGNAQLNDELTFGLLAKVREIPSEFALSQNYPNPFNPTTTMKYALAQDASVTVTVYNMLGQKVKTLVDLQQEAGYYTINWDGTNEFGGRVASGIYIYRLTAGKFTSTLKMNLLK